MEKHTQGQKMIEEELLRIRSETAAAAGAVTEEKLFSAVRAGVAAGARQERDRRRRRWLRRAGYTAATMSLLLAALMLSAAVSPVFASVLRDIPGIQQWLRLIGSDASLTSAVMEEYIQPIHAVAEQDGVRLTVEAIMADESRLLVLYRLEDRVTAGLTLENAELKDDKGNPLTYSVRWTAPENWRMTEEYGMYDMLDFQLTGEQRLPEQVELSGKVGKARLAVKLSIDRSQYEGKAQILPLNHVIEAGGQRIELLQAEIHPLRILLKLRFPEENSHIVHGFIKLRLVDDQGNELVSSMASGGDVREYYFQSSYFMASNSLTLRAEGLYYTDKQMSPLVIDTEKGLLLQAPDNRIHLDTVEEREDHTELVFKLSGLDETDQMWSYGDALADEFTDASGEVFDESDQGFSWASGGTGQPQFNYRLPHDKPFKQPLTFRIRHYPGYVMQPIELRIK
ncbi:DUF4179 domain-containing protein [Paenibacillus sp. SYP-B4298]|uniref:DUF4179 domain-containing protein n=1 Tax=Paenibacillus sp. SYP-B4298 TaxID=2996034 RepID=UPI0022DD8890|nr:DUF4179 domain-containing protein [Paenibacillus sp. SYP-B4298]